MTDAIARARLAVNKSYTYAMRKGSSKPDQALPGVTVAGVRYCDCSDLVAWAYGYQRGDLNTDGIILDARGAQKQWREVPVPEVGGIIVFAGKFSGGKRVKLGHVAIVTEVLEPWRVSTLRIIDCSASNPMGRAIQERGAAHFERARRAGRSVFFAVAV